MKKKKSNKEEKGLSSKEQVVEFEETSELSEKNLIINKDIKTRLRRIEGQVKGIEKMLEAEAGCKDVLVQISAIRAAINKVGCLVLQNYTKDKLIDEENKITEEKLEELVSSLTMFLK